MKRHSAKILVVDDEPDMTDSIARVLRRAGHEAVVETDSARALDLASSERPDLVVTDLRMPGVDGLELMEELRARQIDVPVIVLTGFASVDSAVEAMKRGACDYLAKPFAPEELVVRVEKALTWSQLAEENRYLREHVTGTSHGEIVGESPALMEVLRVVEKVAPTDARVLIVGESGTGKELIARTIHRRSRRSGSPFFAVNCGALTESLLETELFGHERGAFTGAHATKKGFFEVADGGTLFLDEISETTAAFQTKLLRVLQEGEFLRVGGTRTVETDIRLVASTNRDPRKCVADGRLREDLFYRLSVVQIVLPPLRERREDVSRLAAHFISLCARHLRKRVAGIRSEAVEALEQYAWPGNIRELENVIERAVIMLGDGEEIGLEDLPADLLRREPVPSERASSFKEAEREVLLRALRESNWNRSLAAKRLGIGRRTLYDKLGRHGISLRPDR